MEEYGMTLLSDLKQIIEADGITQYTDEQLEAFILKAKSLINIPGITPHIECDVKKDFEGDVYVTEYYPILNDNSFLLQIGDETITPLLIEYDKGIIFLPSTKKGILRCSYTTQICEEEIDNDILPITVEVVRQAAGKDVSSIKEGEVTVSYKNNTSQSDNTSLDALIRNFRAKYDTMVRWV